MRRLSLASFSLAAMFTAASATASTVIYSSNPLPGDSYSTNLSFLGNPIPTGQALTNTPDFFYNNVRGNGTVGINDTFERNGNGSVFFQTVGSNSKADFELLASPTSNTFGVRSATGSFGRLGDLTHLSYEWYRDSSSTNSAVQHPVIRILVDADGDLSTTGDRGGLVFEQAYNGSNVPTDTWVFEDVFAYNSGAGANLWTFGAGMSFAQEGYGNTLTDWINGVGTISADSLVIGFSIGVGSGWGPFVGAADTLTVGFNGVTTTYNFEVIPEPASLALLGLGSLIMLRRRQSA